VTGTVPVGVDQVSTAYALALLKKSFQGRVPNVGRTVDGETFVRVPIEGFATSGELDVRDCGGTSAFLLRVTPKR
jgi:hypothetical protein